MKGNIPNNSQILNGDSSGSDSNDQKTTKQILCNSATAALSLLGESSIQSVMWQIKQHGIAVDPENFDVGKFEYGLRKMFGDGADVLLNLVCIKLCEYARTEIGINLEISPRLSASERIHEIIRLLDQR